MDTDDNVSMNDEPDEDDVRLWAYQTPIRWHRINDMVHNPQTWQANSQELEVDHHRAQSHQTQSRDPSPTNMWWL